jgi:metal-responsive CopG/Arc/MetJ family transcriptional regulator
MSDELHLRLLETSKKKKASYTIDENLLKEFDIYIKAKGLKKSQVIEKMIQVFIEQEKNLF